MWLAIAFAADPPARKTLQPAGHGVVAGGPQFNAGGQFQFPQNYREWIFLSAGLGMTYGSPETAGAKPPHFDNVFVSPVAYRSFLENGKWPDETVLVLEVRSSESKGSINNGGRFQTEIVGVEVEVKHGGKWAFYGFGKGTAPAKQIPATAACYSCHGEHGAVDNTFVQFYPTLLSVARAKGTLRAGQ
jgi:hypothetical protein